MAATDRWRLAGHLVHMPRVLPVLLALTACQGSIGDVEPQTLPPLEPVPGEIEVPDPDACAAAEPSAGSQPLRRLTRDQLRNVYMDGLGLTELSDEVDRKLLSLSEGRTGGFNSSDTAASEEDLRSYVDIAASLASTVTADMSLVDCQLGDAGCFASLIDTVGPRVFRRPLDAEERAQYVGIFDEFSADDGAVVAAETALTALLASPHVLYHPEPVEAVVGEAAPLDAFAFANRIAFFVWNSGPDDALLAAAASGELETEAGLRAEVQRMIAHPRSRRQAENFYRQFLMIDKLDTASPEDDAWYEGLGDKLLAEAYGFVHRVTLEGGSYETLLTADYTFGDEEVASHYGAEAPDADSRIALDPDERSGVLTLPVVMAALGTRSPEIFRGEFISANVLCNAPPEPPEGVELDPTVDRLSTSPCSSCHRSMDPIGYGFAAFDGLGRYIEDEAQGGDVIDMSGSLDENVVGAFSTPRELGTRLAGSTQVHECFADQWFRYSLGRLEQQGDGCSLGAVRAEFNNAGGDLQSLFTAIALSQSFRSRAASDLNPEGAEQ